MRMRPSARTGASWPCDLVPRQPNTRRTVAGARPGRGERRRRRRRVRGRRLPALTYPGAPADGGARGTARPAAAPLVAHAREPALPGRRGPPVEPAGVSGRRRGGHAPVPAADGRPSVPFGSLYVPVPGGTTPVGVLVVLRYATRGVPVGGADRRRLEALARQLGADIAAQDRPAEWDGGPCPSASFGHRAPDAGRTLRVGHRTAATVTADERTHAILGAMSPRTGRPRSMEALTAAAAARGRVRTVDAGPSRAARSAEPACARRMRLRWSPDGRPLLVELSGTGRRCDGDRNGAG